MRQADTDFMRSRVNILLVGWDQSPERDDSDSVMYRDSKNNFRSDVLMLLAVDFQQGNAHLISILPGYHGQDIQHEGALQDKRSLCQGRQRRGRRLRIRHKNRGKTSWGCQYPTMWG